MKSKPRLSRFSVSIPSDVVRRFDQVSKARGYGNRSQALADLLRRELVDHQSHADRHEIAGTVTLVYDHHKRNLQAHLTDIQHDHPGLIIAVLHVHLDHHNCMEVLAVRGRAKAVRALADALGTVKGVKHSKLSVTTTGKEFIR